MPNAMQATMPNAMQADSILDLDKSVLARFVDWGKPVLTESMSRMSRLRDYPAVVSGLLYGARFGKGVAMFTVAGVAVAGIIKIDRWYRLKPKYNYKKAEDVILDKCKDKSVSPTNARKIFESEEVQEYGSRWSIPMTKIKFMFPSEKIRFIKGFVKYFKEKKTKKPTPTPDSNVTLTIPSEFYDKPLEERGNVVKALDMATTYLDYLEESWITKRDLTFAGLGVAVTGVALKLVGKL